MAKSTACATEHADTGLYGHTTYKKQMHSYGHTWFIRECSGGNPLAIFAPHLLEYQLVFTFSAGETS